ncbi:uncharacterized protein [Enoplosus armatus]
MMRLLFLCLLLLLPAATAVSEENEGSADGGLDDDDDEDLYKNVTTDVPRKQSPGLVVGKNTGVEETTDQFTLIVIVVAVTVLTLSVATIFTIMLVRRHMHRQQGIYSVPAEQDQKGAV